MWTWFLLVISNGIMVVVIQCAGRGAGASHNACLIKGWPCDVYVIFWRKMSIWMDFTDRYVLEIISNRI